jgi:hypothetical protein
MIVVEKAREKEDEKGGGIGRTVIRTATSFAGTVVETEEGFTILEVASQMAT